MGEELSRQGGAWEGQAGRGAVGILAGGEDGPYLPQLGHGLAGDDLVAVQPGHKAQGLELALAPLQLPQD